MLLLVCVVFKVGVIVVEAEVGVAENKYEQTSRIFFSNFLIWQDEHFLTNIKTILKAIQFFLYTTRMHVFRKRE